MYTVKVPVLGFENISMMDLKPLDSDFSVLELDKHKHINMHLICLDSLRNIHLDFRLNSEFMKNLELEETTNMKTYFSIVINHPVEDSVINLSAPIIVNNDKKLLGQYLIRQKIPKLFVTLDEVNT